MHAVYCDVQKLCTTLGDPDCSIYDAYLVAAKLS